MWWVISSNKCDSVKQMQSICKSLESPVKSKIFIINPRIFKSVRNRFFSENLCVNKFSSRMFG